MVTGLATLGLCGLYTCALNPEVQSLKFAYKVKTEFSRKLDESPEPKIIFVGGSSCAHQLDTTLLNRDFKLRSVNMGHLAGMGMYVNTAIGMAQARPGDSLVLALEPGTLSDAGITQLGYQFLSATDSGSIRRQLEALNAKFSENDEINALRPGLYNLVTLMAKLIMRQPLIRFDEQGLSPDGFEEEAARRHLDGMSAAPVPLAPGAQDLLRRVTDWGRQNQVRVAYLMPWGLYQKDQEEQARQENRRLLTKIDTLIPVLRDDKLGVWDKPGDFSDTELHLTLDGAMYRTTYLAPILLQWQLFNSLNPVQK